MGQEQLKTTKNPKHIEGVKRRHFWNQGFENVPNLWNKNAKNKLYPNEKNVLSLKNSKSVNIKSEYIFSI